MELHRQHLIDPVICIRCNTCEEICPLDAITHNESNYVVSFEVCNSCRACVSPCPTGAIDSWLMVRQAWSLEDQFGFEELPPQALPEDKPETRIPEADFPSAQPVDSAIAAIVDAATSATGRTLPPYSAAHPYINLYRREAPALAIVAGNYRLTDKDASSDIRHIVLDFGQQAFPILEGQSIGIVPPGMDDKGRPHLIRLYSVASPRDGERPNHNNISLTVKRVIVQNEDGSIHRGVGSNYVCDLQKGDEVPVTGPFGDSFLMPNHPQANIVMICTGTGSAPFRAFTERRRRHQQDAPGKMLLFFGARSPGELPYFGPLTKLPKSLIDVNFAFSRIPDQTKEYVQDKMRERASDLVELLESPETFLYICGLKGMEMGVEEALADICRRHGFEWSQRRGLLRREGRFHVETY